MSKSGKKTRRDPSLYIKKILVDPGCADHPYAREIIARAGLPVSVVQDPAVTVGESNSFAESLTFGKRHLYLTRNQGKFLKECPGTREYICCGYQVINIGMNCPMDCVYCILQAYLNAPWLSFFVNIDDLFSELDRALAENPGKFWRIGTGEFTDSLVLDRFTGLSRKLVTYMRDKKNAIIELKTKTSEIDNLADLDHNGRCVVSWSLNSPKIMAEEELRAATLDERLQAAVRCADWGYSLAFHFDPIIYYPGWQEEYRETIEKLFAVVPAEKIVWISMGCLRFMPGLKSVVRTRFPGVRFLDEEFVTGLDNKMRYFRTLRVEMYRAMRAMLLDHASPGTCIYLCMESDEMWQEVFGYTPGKMGGLEVMLDRAAGREAY